MRLSESWLLLSLPFFAASQTLNLNSLLSEAQSIYTEATSILGGGGSSTSSSSSSTSPTTTSRSSTSNSSSRPTASSSSLSSTSTSSTESSVSSTSRTTSIVSSPTSTPAATSPSQTAASDTSATSSGNHSTNVLAIVLGCTLGALAIAVFLLILCFFCRRRRRNGSRVAKRKSILTGDDDSDVWTQHEKPKRESSRGPTDSLAYNGVSTAPLMAEHENPYVDHRQNPFVPEPPPARRSVPRAGLQDHGSHSNIRPDHDPHYDSHPLAAGVGGFALGGLAAQTAHHYNRERSAGRGYLPLDDKDVGRPSEEGRTTAEPLSASHRRSGSLNRVGTKEPWPFYDAQTRPSNESSRSRRASSTRAQDVFATPEETPSGPTPAVSHTARDAALGGLAGAGLAAALRHPRHRDPKSRRKGILKQTTSDDSEPSSVSQDSSKDISRSDEHIPSPRAHGSGPHELGTGNIPPSPIHKERSRSALGTAAPAAALGSVYTGDPTHHKEHRRASADSTPRHSQDMRRADTPPAVPSRSPHRSSLTPKARYSLDNNGTAELPTEPSRTRQLISPQNEPDTSPEVDEPMSPVSPITASQAGTLTNSEMQTLVSARAAGGTETAVQGGHLGGVSNHVQESSAAAGSRGFSKKTDDNNSENSGLLSAIRNIFSSQQEAWAADEEVGRTGRHRTRNRFSWEDPKDEDISEQSPQAGPVSSIPWQKPTPMVSAAAARESHYGVLDRVSRSSSDEDAVRTSLMTASGHQAAEQTSRPVPGDFSQPSSARAMPEGRLSSDSTYNNELTPVISNSSRGRGRFYSGYGIGSGDPFDLASTRTDSQMTGVSLSNYREPTLAELKEQVQAEDRERERQSWKHHRSSSAGLRYGDDRNMFDVKSAALGIQDYDRFYGGDGRYPRRDRVSGGSVGRAY